MKNPSVHLKGNILMIKLPNDDDVNHDINMTNIYKVITIVSGHKASLDETSRDISENRLGLSRLGLSWLSKINYRC